MTTLAIILAALYVMAAISTVAEYNRLGRRASDYSVPHRLIAWALEGVLIALLLVIFL